MKNSEEYLDGADSAVEDSKKNPTFPLEQNGSAFNSRIDDPEPPRMLVDLSRGNGRGWRNYSSLEKTLWISLGAITLVAVGLLIAVIVIGVELEKEKDRVFPPTPTTTTGLPWITMPSPTTTPTTIPTTTTLPPGYNQCLEMKCVMAAAKMSESMNPLADPCENFFEYACGNWNTGKTLPGTTNHWNPTTELKRRVTNQINGILQREIPIDERDEHPVPFLLAKDFYDSCLEQDESQTGKIELAALAVTLLGPGPINDLTLLGERLGRIRHEVGGNYLFSLSVDLDEEDSENNIIYLDQPQLGLARELLLSEDPFFRNEYQNLIIKFWELLYPADRIDAEKIVSIEMALANISTHEEFRRDRGEMYNPFSLEDLANITSNINFSWVSYFEQVFLNLSEATENHDLDFANTTYVVRDLDFFGQFGEVLNGIVPADLSNYIRWRIFFDYGNDANAEIRSLFYEFYKKTQGFGSPPTLWKSCTEQTNALFGMAISYHYVNEHIANETIEKAENLEASIQSAFAEILGALDWIDDETKSTLLNKTEQMSSFIGYPEWLDNRTALEEYYDGLDLDGQSSHFKNVLNVSKWHNLQDLMEIFYPKSSESWMLDPTTVKSYYFPNYNSINFPAALVQYPFLTQPLEALNYGAMGAFIGHEIIQGFSDTGIQSDADGNLANWWSNETTLEAFLNKVNCFVTQYENYTVEEINMHLNGKLTLGLNIADNGGLRQAFKAYQTYASQSGPEKWLPGMTQFSPEKLFFLSYAQSMCGSYAKPYLQQITSTGSETPNYLRVKGALANSLEFATTWECPVPSPNTSCQLW